MKKIIPTSTFLLTVLLFTTNLSVTADRFWVAGTTSNFSNSANWSTTSGGPGGASVPVYQTSPYLMQKVWAIVL